MLFEQIKKIMKEKNILQLYLADAIGKNQSLIARFLTGEILPARETFKDILKILEVSATEYENLLTIYNEEKLQFLIKRFNIKHSKLLGERSVGIMESD